MTTTLKKIAVLSGAGISAESGLNTFRDSGGLWEQYEISEVATIEAWQKNPKLVLSFYDARRAQVAKANPNIAHQALVQLEEFYDVKIITQNIDDLHERAGSKNVLHLHGEIIKSRSVNTDDFLYPASEEIKLGDTTPEGEQLRPHIVWFGEPVPRMSEAEAIVKKADILIVVGTSLNVYPAAGLRYASKETSLKYLVDPDNISITDQAFIHLQGTATEKLPQLVNSLIKG